MELSALFSADGFGVLLIIDRFVEVRQRRGQICPPDPARRSYGEY